MKSALAAVVVGAAFTSHLLSSAPVTKQQQRNGEVVVPRPFGFAPGETKLEIKILVGDSHVVAEGADYLILDTAPVPYKSIHRYMLLISPTEGLAKVVGETDAVSTNAFGDSIKDQFRELRESLERKYGIPSGTVDGIQPGSIWKEPQDWTMGLAKEERFLSAIWKMPACDIGISAFASSSTSGGTRISYEYAGKFSVWERERKARESDSF